MIEDVPLDTFDNEAYDENDDLLNTGFSADEETTYDSATPGSRIDRQRRELVRGKIRDWKENSTPRSRQQIQALWQRTPV